MAKRPGFAPKAPEDRSIPRKHLVFLRLYHAGDNGRPITGKEAAIRAGYPAASAVSQANFILAKANCKAWIAAQEKVVEEKHGITMDAIVKELAKVGFSNMADYIEDDGNGKPQFRPISEIQRDHMAAITELTLDIRKEFEGGGKNKVHVADVEKVRFRLASKVEGLVNLGKLLGYFPKNDAGGSDNPDAPERTVTIRVVGGLPQRKPRG